ncbi:MAG: HAD family hydrolase [Rhodospirillaceae bacterium]
MFDWDNTLVSTWPIIHDALNHTFRAYGKPEWTLEETRLKVRKSMRDSFPAIFGDAWERAGEVFYERYEEIHAIKLAVAPGAEALIDALDGAGVYMAVVSNKKGFYLRREAEHLGWSGHFGAIVGAMDVDRDKPAPDPVAKALLPARIVPGPSAWFVGDSDIDMECAHATGCIPILVRDPPPQTGEFSQFPPAAHFYDCDSLCKFCKTL